MKKKKILYRVATLLFAFVMLGSAIPDMLSSPIAVKGMHEDLGYPLYLLPFVGFAKLAGVTVLLLPAFPRLKEWAYAGLFIDLCGATYSITASGLGTAGALLFMLIPLVPGILSYIYFRQLYSFKTS